MMRALVIDDEVRATAKALVDYAEKPEHWYVIPRDFPRESIPGTTPGLMPEHVLNLNTYRCVFSFTLHERYGIVYRHLSISVPVEHKLPHPAACIMIARLFKFTGKPSNWLMNPSESENAVVIAQEVDFPTAME